MTEITAPKSPVTTAEFADGIREQLKYSQGVTVEQATPADVYVASSLVVRHYLQDAWFKTQQDMVNGNTKAVGYLSASPSTSSQPPTSTSKSPRPARRRPAPAT